MSMRRRRLLPLGEAGVWIQDACFAMAMRASLMPAAGRLGLVRCGHLVADRETTAFWPKESL